MRKLFRHDQQGRPDHTSDGAAAPPVKGWGHHPRKGCPPPKKGKRSEKRKEEKGQTKRKKEKKNTGKAVYY